MMIYRSYWTLTDNQEGDNRALTNQIDDLSTEASLLQAQLGSLKSCNAELEQKSSGLEKDVSRIRNQAKSCVEKWKKGFQEVQDNHANVIQIQEGQRKTLGRTIETLSADLKALKDERRTLLDSESSCGKRSSSL